MNFRFLSINLFYGPTIIVSENVQNVVISSNEAQASKNQRKELTFFPMFWGERAVNMKYAGML